MFTLLPHWLIAQAPETSQHKRIFATSDVYAFGILVSGSARPG